MANQFIIKRTAVTIISLLIIITSYSVFATENEISNDSETIELVKMIQPQDSSYITYLPKTLFTTSQAPQERPSTLTTPVADPGFLVVVNATIYPAIKTSLVQYSLDVNASGYSTKIVTGTWPTIEQVRAILKGEWQNNGTTAAVLIGDFPIPWFNLSVGGGGYQYFPCDLYYMDLDGNWGDSNGDGNFETHTGNVAADITFGRLPANMMTGDEAQLLNNYFKKNHLYRTGKLKLPNKDLVYVDDDWFGSAEGWKSDAELNYENVTMVKNGVTTCAQDYKKRLVEDYEFVQVHCHANHRPTRHNFKVSGLFEAEDVNSTDIKNLDPHTFFTILFTCGSSNYSCADFLCGAYIFADSYGLVSISSSRPGGMLNYNDFYQPLSEDKSIGEAFKIWFVLNAESSKSWFYGMALIGDPTLIPNQYDIEYQDLAFSNPTPYSAETIYLHPTINSALDNCSGVEVRAYDGDPNFGGLLIGTKVVDFGWNTSVELNFSWQAVAGSHEIWVVADYNDGVQELNETNNIGHKTINVYQLPTVELVPDNAVVYTCEDINVEGLTYGGVGTIASYYFEFGDGNNSGWLTTNITTHNYTENGLYNAKLQIIDDNDHYAWSPEVPITVRNRAPVAILETDLPVGIFEVFTGEVITFNGSKSYDTDGTISSYFWDFGDDATAFGTTVNHSFEEDGKYLVKLYIMDNDAGTNEVNITLTVTNRLPVAIAEVDKTVIKTNTIITFSAAQSFDLDGQLESYNWEFGDGNLSNYKTPQHKYSDDGNYTVILTVIDNDGGEGQATMYVAVLNRPPTAEITSSVQVVNTHTKLYFNATVSDSDGVVDLTYWDFGDSNNAMGLAVVHEFENDGIYTINFTATDDDGAQAIATLIITVKNVAPNAHFSITPLQGNTTTIFSFGSNSSDTDGTITNYTWEFGDGNVSYGPTVEHQYAESGNYTITLRIWDDDGELTEITEYLVIAKAPVITPPDDPEPNDEGDRNKTPSKDDEADSYGGLMIIGIVVIVVIIILIAAFFIISRKKRLGQEVRLPSAEEAREEPRKTKQKAEPDQPEEPKVEIEWDDDEDY